MLSGASADSFKRFSAEGAKSFPAIDKSGFSHANCHDTAIKQNIIKAFIIRIEFVIFKF